VSGDDEDHGVHQADDGGENPILEEPSGPSQAPLQASRVLQLGAVERVARAVADGDETDVVALVECRIVGVSCELDDLAGGGETPV
jgi:hypothetical protein